MVFFNRKEIDKMLYDYNQMDEIIQNNIDNKGIKSYGLKAINLSIVMKNVVVETMKRNNIIVSMRKDGNMGQAIEGLIKAILNDTQIGIYSKANECDYNDLRSEIEIKTTINSKDLCTPLTQPKRVWLVTPTGTYTINKKDLEIVFANPNKFKRFVKIENKGLRLKPTAIELGKPNNLLNKILCY